MALRLFSLSSKFVIRGSGYLLNHNNKLAYYNIFRDKP